jgi:exopolyphosphatase/pppGpp-phosphohydrolase
MPSLVGPIAILLAVFLTAPLDSQSPLRGSGVMCAIDMGSNTFRRIVGSFKGGKYVPHNLEKKTMGIGDEVERNGGISDAKLAEIGAVLSAFKASCDKEGVTRIAAIGTAAFRDAANGARVLAIAAMAGMPMEIASEQRESELAYLVGSLGRDGYAVIDHGSRSIELVSKDAGALRHGVLGLGYRVAFEQFFAHASDPSAAVDGYSTQLRRGASAAASFMKGRQKLVGLEFGDMIEVLFERGDVEGRVMTLQELKQQLAAITASGRPGFKVLQQTPDIDRALPRLVAAVTLLEAFGYSGIELTDRELGSGLIIEAGAR